MLARGVLEPVVACQASSARIASPTMTSGIQRGRPDVRGATRARRPARRLGRPPLVFRAWTHLRSQSVCSRVMLRRALGRAGSGVAEARR